MGDFFDSLGTLSSWSEQDVREDFLAPLLKRLGYAKGTSNDIFRQQSLHLRYPRLYIGTKKPKTDPVLRGEADYILEVTFATGRKVRWVLEAKSPSEKLDTDALEQAYTYANHPEVCAVYYCLSNAHEFRIYQTTGGTSSPPLLTVSKDQFPEGLEKLAALLTPDSILRDWKEQTVDPGLPLAPGLRSIAQIVGGFIQYRNTKPAGLGLEGLTISVIDGAIERVEAGGLLGYFRTRSPYAQIQEMIERLGLSNFEASCPDKTLSVDAQVPSAFKGTQVLVFPPGTDFFDIRTGTKVNVPTSIQCRVEVAASGHVVGCSLRGEFSATFTFSGLSIGVTQSVGFFEMNLA